MKYQLHSFIECRHCQTKHPELPKYWKKHPDDPKCSVRRGFSLSWSLSQLITKTAYKLRSALFQIKPSMQCSFPGRLHSLLCFLNILPFRHVDHEGQRKQWTSDFILFLYSRASVFSWMKSHNVISVIHCFMPSLKIDHWRFTFQS